MDTLSRLRIPGSAGTTGPNPENPEVPELDRISLPQSLLHRFEEVIDHLPGVKKGNPRKLSCQAFCKIGFGQGILDSDKHKSI